MSDSSKMYEVVDVAENISPTRKNVQGKVGKVFNYSVSILTLPTRNFGNDLPSILLSFNQLMINFIY